MSVIEMLTLADAISLMMFVAGMLMWVWSLERRIKALEDKHGS